MASRSVVLTTGYTGAQIKKKKRIFISIGIGRNFRKSFVNGAIAFLFADVILKEKYNGRNNFYEQYQNRLV
jgi:hypothetical protein